MDRNSNSQIIPGMKVDTEAPNSQTAIVIPKRMPKICDVRFLCLEIDPSRYIPTFTVSDFLAVMQCINPRNLYTRITFFTLWVNLAIKQQV